MKHTLVKIKNKIALFKGDEKAERIELVQFEELGFEVVAQKDLYNVGDTAVFVMPDHSLSDLKIFDSYTQPGGDPKKSRLGSKNRVRAIKFNFHKGDGMPVFSQGILLPLNEVEAEIGKVKTLDDLEKLKIVKWEEPDDNSGSGLAKGASAPFPTGMYKTDETNWLNVSNKIGFPIHLVGSVKVDGSSITIYSNSNGSGIASRNQGKPLTFNKVVGRRDLTFFEKVKKFFGFPMPDVRIFEQVESDSDFVIAGKPYLEKLDAYCKANGVGIALRGELNGGSAKGSGNKNNPASKEGLNIKFFGADLYDTATRKMPDKDFRKLADSLGLNTVPQVFDQIFETREELEKVCNDYFAKNLIEGIVLRTPDSNFSAKFMNPAYDAVK